MSIFDNDNLIEKLIGAGLDFNTKFAQANPAIGQGAEPILPLNLDDLKNIRSDDPTISNLQFARALTVNLQRSVGDPSAPPLEEPFSTDGNKPAVNLMANSTSLGAFLNWIADNKIQYQGKRFVWKKDGHWGDPATKTNWIKGPDEILVPQTAGRYTSIDVSKPVSATGEYEEMVAFADKEILLKYLAYIRDVLIPRGKDPRAAEVVISRLISEMNSKILPAERIDSHATAKDKVPAIDLEMVVDAFPNETLVLDNSGQFNTGLNSAPTFDNLPTHLTVGNLRDLSSFTAWLTNMWVKQPNTPKPIKAYDLEASDADSCAALRALYNRAMRLSSIGTGRDNVKPNYSKAVIRYLSAIKEFAPSFHDSSGRPCSVIAETVAPSTTQPGTGQPGQPGAAQPATPGGKLSSDEVAKLTELLTSLPLEVEAIDLAKINRFIDNAAAFDRSVASGQVSGDSVVRFNRAIGALQTMMTSSGYPRIELSWSFPQIAKAYLRDPNNESQFFKDKLVEIVSTAATLISALYSAYGPKLPQNIKSNMFQQTNYVAKENFSRLESFQDVINKRFRIRS
jgi:hypothetical protein